MRRLAPPDHPDLLVGAATGDDAAVWRMDENRALVFTADFITPVVDDARTWGRVAAVNAISDVYAMGGTPLIALNLVGWNVEHLSTDLLAEVMLGAQDVAQTEGFFLVGGHTVDDPEPKFGLAVVGEVDPRVMFTNAGLRADDLLVLTKPLGIGVVSTAIKREVAPDEVANAAIELMTRSNAEAAAAAHAAGATGATDVTGFGLLGHLGRMAEESGVDVEIDASAVPILDGVRELAEAGAIPGGSERNLAWAEERLDRGSVDSLTVQLLADAQTSGGLVFGAAADAADTAVAELTASGHTAAVIGRVTGPGTGKITAL